uniref:Signiferin-2.1 n=1 Tax=Crinia signifera TaxID=326986 RepID=SIG21_CRISI|nr:RecName: Full=Signiferin-2.1 [Crinia signifera]
IIGHLIKTALGMLGL